jgi:hypothetical protein
MDNLDACYQAYQKFGSERKAAASLGMAKTTFRSHLKRAMEGDRPVKKESPKIDYAKWRDRGTTQVPVNEGVVIKAPADFDLYLTSDWHAGHEDCYYRGLHELIEEVGSNDSARIILGGDQMEMTPAGHHDGGRNSDSYIDGQIIRTTDACKPIADKIDMIYGGNHGKARLTKVGIDPDLIMASMLGAHYSPVPKVVIYRTPVGDIKICGAHGKSGGQNSMPELRRMKEVYPGCQLYHAGHTHDLYAEHDGSLVYDKNGKESWEPVWMCRTGSMLGYAEYARYAMYRPKPIGYLIVKVRGGRIDRVSTEKVQIKG